MVSRFGGALLVSTAVMAASATAHAEKEVALGASYDARAPVGDFRRLIPETSFGGFQARWDFYPLDALATGIEVQYNLFQRSSKTDTISTDDAAFTGTTFRYAGFWSLMPTVRYYLFAHSTIRPYAELDAGVVAVTSAVLVSDQSRRDLVTAFIVQPSVGLLWRLTPDRTSNVQIDPEEAAAGPLRRPLESMVGLTASVTYAFTTADVIAASNVSYAGFQLGIYAKP
jgi:hypothetical protein